MQKVKEMPEHIPEQLEWDFDFDIQYSDTRLKDAVRGLKTIAREAIRLGATKRTVNGIMELLAIGNPIVHSASDAIEEQI